MFCEVRVMGCSRTSHKKANSRKFGAQKKSRSVAAPAHLSLKLPICYCVTVRGPENSEVSPSTESVAVAVTVWPAGTAWEGTKLKVTLPLELVLTALLPRNFCPSLPEGLEKNSTTKGSLRVLLSLAWMVVVPLTVLAEVKTGLFCRSLEP